MCLNRQRSQTRIELGPDVFEDVAIFDFTEILRSEEGDQVLLDDSEALNLEGVLERW